MSDKELNDQLLAKQAETFKTEGQNLELNKVDYRSPEMLADIHRIEQDRINKYIESQKETTTPKLSYEELEQRINNQNYDRSVFTKWKRGNSKSMERVTKGLHRLDELLKTGVGMTDYADVENAYFVLQEACVDYLTTHSPKTAEGEARYRMVQQIGERIRRELGYIRVNSENLTKEDMQKTWAVVLAQPRVIVLEEDQIHVPKEAERSGTASLFKITEKSGESFFKVSEKLSNADSAAGYVAEIIDGITREMIGLKDVGHPLYSGMKEEDKEQRGKELQSLLDTALKFKEYWEKEIDINTSISGTEENQWKTLKEKYPDLKEEEKKNYLAFFREMEKRITINVSGIKNGRVRKGSDLDVRNEATSIMAEALGLTDMIMESQTVTLDVKGEKIKGVKMKKVEGSPYLEVVNPKTMIGKNVNVTPSVMKQYANLHLFDIICGQVDRNGNNLIIDHKDDGKTITVEKITGIDNDLSFGMLTFQDIMEGDGDTLGYLPSPVKKETKPYVLPGGEIRKVTLSKKTAVKAVDQKFADRILALSPEAIPFLLRGKISDEEIKACQNRLKGLQQLLKQVRDQDKKKKKTDKVFLSSDKEWEDFTAKMHKIRDLKGLTSAEKKKVDQEKAEIISCTYIPSDILY
ncbi:MAG: hypothetical protein K6E95_03940 [Lachnospiraceae bacterium]|nr:hypothetical protein [Lachnospiraceae bacterium]